MPLAPGRPDRPAGHAGGALARGPAAASRPGRALAVHVSSMLHTMNLREALTDVVGDRHVLTDPEVVASFSTDWTGRFGAEAGCVVRPGDTAEVAGVLRACAAAGAAVVPQGGNTG